MLNIASKGVLCRIALIPNETVGLKRFKEVYFVFYYIPKINNKRGINTLRNIFHGVWQHVLSVYENRAHRGKARLDETKTERR